MTSPTPLSPLPALSVGEFAPWFVAPTPNSPHFNFNTLAGRYVLLAFLPPPGAARDRALAAFDAHAGLFDDLKLTCFMVLRDAPSIAVAKNRARGLRWFLDAEGEISRLYGTLAAEGREAPFWLLLDPFLRVLSSAPMGRRGRIFNEIADLPALADYAGVPLCAPVLIAPRIFEPDLCKRLIAYYEADGGTPSGVMRDVDGKTVGVLDDFKRRKDVTVVDEDLRRDILVRPAPPAAAGNPAGLPVRGDPDRALPGRRLRRGRRRLFRPHRDNLSLGTAHRRFAVSINLNAEAFEGGDLRFAEFGPRTYRPPTGGAVVFCCSLLHEATPVTRGRRYAFLPFLYDEAGARIRAENLQFVAPPAG